MKSSEARKQILRDHEVQAAYRAQKLATATAREVIAARLHAGLSQAELAKRVGTQQPSIARLEGGSYMPTLAFLHKVAEALHAELSPPRLIENEQTVATSPLNTAVEKIIVQPAKGLVNFAYPLRVAYQSDSESVEIEGVAHA